MNKKLLFTVIFMLSFSIFFSGCGKDNDTQKKPLAIQEVKVGLLRLTSTAPFFIGIEKGFFKEEGLDLKVEWFQAAQPIAVATASNKVDIGATGITASIYNMVASGQKLTIVADKGREEKGYPSSSIVISKELVNKGVKNIKDLKGAKIGITQKGSTFHYMFGRLLEENGLTINDVELVPLGKLSSVMASLEGGQIDACILNEPNPTKVEKAGYGKILIQVGDVIDYQTSGVFFSPQMNENTELGTRFMKAYIAACNYYYDAVLVKENGQTKPGKNYDEVISIIAKYTDMPVEDIKIGLPYIDRNGKLLESDITTQIKWYNDNKLLEKPIEAQNVVNMSFFEKALKS